MARLKTTFIYGCVICGIVLDIEVIKGHSAISINLGTKFILAKNGTAHSLQTYCDSVFILTVKV